MTEQELARVISRIGLRGALLSGAFEDTVGTDINNAVANVPVYQPLKSVGYSRNIAMFGDSRCFLSHFVSGNNKFFKGWGIATWAQTYSEGEASFPPALNFGVAGDTTNQMLARIDTAIKGIVDASANMVVIFAGTNDVPTSDIPLELTKQNIRGMIRKFMAKGILPIFMGETPRGQGSYDLGSQAKKDQLKAVNDFYQQEVSQICPVLNSWDLWVDPASGSNYYPLPGMTRDEIHPSIVGAQVIGKPLGELLKKYISMSSYELYNNAVYNSASNVFGSFSPNPLFQGTPSNGLAPSWQPSHSNNAGLTIAQYTETDVSGVVWQVATVTGTSGSTSPELTWYSNADITKMVVGQSYKAVGKFKSQGNGCIGVGLAILQTPNYYQLLDGDAPDVALSWPTYPVGGTKESPAYVHASATNGALTRWIVNIAPSATVNFTVKFAKTGIVKIDV